MAVSEITTGEAIGGDYQTKGDRKHPGPGPDYDGEVRLIKRSAQSFINYLDDYKDSAGNRRYVAYRPNDVTVAHTIAELAIKACNNPNIGYSQTYSSNPNDGKYYNPDPDGFRSAIFKYGADTSVPINCDCSSLGSYCAQVATGCTIGAANSQSIGGKLKGTGMFTEYSTDLITLTNMPYNGDIFARPSSATYGGGHVFMVVAGNPREGLPDESISVTGFAGNMVTSGFNMPANGLGITLYNVDKYCDEFGQTFTFLPRTSEPTVLDIFYDQSYGAGPNGSYAWGRFSEVMTTNCMLCQAEPRKWYLYKEDGYERGVAPSLGAVMCYTNIYDESDPGIVCIVEKIDKDQIVVSQRSPSSGDFESFVKEKRYGSWDMDLDGDGRYEYRFQGFIYNPTVSFKAEATTAKDKFIEIATEQVGTDGSFTEKHTKVKTSTAAWSAAFINAVAKVSGSILNVILPNTLNCSDIGRVGVLRGMGRWLDGPSSNKFPEPQVGDVALFRMSDGFTRSNKYAADKAGIVIEVKGASGVASGTNQGTAYTFVVAMGDFKKQVVSKTYTTNSGSFSGLFRPNWERVDGTTGSVSQYTNIEGLYTEGTTLQDAAIRDLRYVNLTKNGFEPSIKSTGLKLCAINYTGMLANLYSAFAEVSSSSATNADLVVDLWNNSVKSVFQTDENSKTVSYAGEGVAVSVDPNATITGSANGESSTGSNLVVSESGGKVSVQTNAQTDIMPDGASQGSKVLSINGMSAFFDTSTVSGMSVFNIIISQSLVLTIEIQNIYNQLLQEVQNSAACIGIMANMYHLTAFDSNAEDEITGGAGLLLWKDDRGRAMKKFCLDKQAKTSWVNNPEKQISFIFYEISTNRMLQLGLESIKKVSADPAGARRAARLFLDYYILQSGPMLSTDQEILRNVQIEINTIDTLEFTSAADATGEATNKELQEYQLVCGWVTGFWKLFFGDEALKEEN